ncbi:MAG TPA: hypothetical protein VHZ95_03030 [Polyangiales bacterium]|nr:hypothetical protein [Polyangiales bacterium]
MHAVESEVQKPKTATLSQRFQSRDQAELLMLLDELTHGEPDAHQAARAVSELLMAGQADVVTDHALETLGRLGVHEGRDALESYTHHRRAETRQRAYTALAQLKEPSVAAREAEGLRDAAPEVRAAAARALGELKATSATKDLLRALGRGVSEAAVALGQCGDASSVESFDAFVGKQPLDVMLAGYANYLQRDDIPESAKLHIIAALEEVAGGTVKQFLSEQLTTDRGVRSPALQRAISASIARIRVEPVGSHGAVMR